MSLPEGTLSTISAVRKGEYMKRLPWKYLAGLFDGDGCIDLQVSYGKYIRPRLRITLANNCKFILEYIKNSYGGTIIECDRTKENSNWQVAHTWSVTGFKDSLYFIHNLLPYLIIKKEQAKLILWVSKELKGKWLNDTIRQNVREELKLMKKDPHRLSDKAIEKIQLML